MDKWFQPTLYNGCNYLCMLLLKLIHVSKMGPRNVWFSCGFDEHGGWSFESCVIFRYRNEAAGMVNDDVIKWKYFPRYWPFVRGIHQSPMNSPHKGQWRGALMVSLICAWINGWVNNGEAGDLRPHRAQYDITVMSLALLNLTQSFICQKKWK